MFQAHRQYGARAATMHAIHGNVLMLQLMVHACAHNVALLTSEQHKNILPFWANMTSEVYNDPQYQELQNEKRN